MNRIPAIEELVYCVSNITMLSNGNANNPCIVGNATGFFYEYDDKPYLVTNRHVVINERDHFYPDSLLIYVHTSRTSNIHNLPITLPLYDEDHNPLWLEHPNQPQFEIIGDSNLIDVVAVPISNYINVENVNVRYLRPNDLLPEDIILHLGTDVLVLCYPMGFYDTMHNLPIVKKGTLAISYGQHFDGNRFFIIDTNLPAGTSGGPVFLHSSTTRTDREGHILLWGFPTYLLGIHSAEYVVDGVDLGLNVVWYPDIINEILQNIDH